MRLGNQCARGASRNTLSAVDATRHVHSFVKRSSDSRFGTAVDEVNTGDTLDFVADAHTSSALNTFFGIPNNRFTGGIDWIMISLSDEPPTADTKRLGKHPKVAVSIAFAKEAVVGMVGEQQFDDGSSGIDNAVRLGFDLHASGNRKGTGRHETSLSFDFYDTDSASTGWCESFVVAEGGHINSGAAESVQQHFALGGFDVTTIDFNLDGIGHV